MKVLDKHSIHISRGRHRMEKELFYGLWLPVAIGF